MYRTYDDGTMVVRDTPNLKLLVSDPDWGRFEVSGFKDEHQMSLFEQFGDFLPGKDNDFFTIANAKANLRWEYLA